MTGTTPAPGAPVASGLDPAPDASANPAAGPPLVQIDNLSRSYQEAAASTSCCAAPRLPSAAASWWS